MISSTPINQAIDSNKQIYQKMQVTKGSSNRAMMLSAYQNDKVQFYNDEKAKKQENKKKRNKIITLAFTGISAAATLTGVIFSFIKNKKNNHIDLSKLKNLKIDPKKLGFDTDKFKNSKLFKKLEPIMNFGINFGTIRDDFARRAVEKTKGTKFEFIHTGSEKLRKQYHKWASDGAKESYEVARNNLQVALQKHGESRDIAKFDDFFKYVGDTTTQRFTQGKTITEEFFAKGKDGKMRPLKQIGADLTSDVIADKRIKDVYDKYLIKDLPDELLKDADVKQALSDYNDIVLNVIEKHRDTNMGNAISDAAGMLTALGGLGAAVATADDKKERKSTILNLGFPILSTIAFMIYGNIKNIAGVKSMVFGLALGEIAKIAAKIIDKATTSKNKETVKA